MNSIFVITNEWIDIIYLNNNIAIRKANQDSGSYELTEYIFKVYWNKWGLEVFTKVDNIYYNCNNGIFELQLETNEWNDVCIFNINSKKVVKKYNNHDNEGLYFFKDNNLYIEWNKSGIEIFNQLNLLLMNMKS